MEHLITTGGVTYRVTSGDEDMDAVLAWLVESRGERVQIVALSRQQVLTRIGRAAIPTGFPDPDVVIGDAGSEAGGWVRGWLPETVQRWQDEQVGAPATTAPADDEQDQGDDRGADDATTEPADPAATASAAVGWAVNARLWSETAMPRVDRNVVILSGRGAVSPSGVVLSKGPLRDGADLGQFVWHRWPQKPIAGNGPAPTPQIWITAEALETAGMKPPKRKLEASADLSADVGKLFGCEITSATAGWFTASFRAPDQSAETRRVHLVLLPFLWLDAARQRPKDQGLAGTIGTVTELPDDEGAAVAVLGERIAWLSRWVRKDESPLLPASRPATVGAALLDTVRRRSRSQQRVEAWPLPDTVYAETPRLDPDIDDWRHVPKTAKGDAVDVEVDQRAAFLASAGQVDLGYGVPVELRVVDPAVFEAKTPYGLWRLTTPPAESLDGLTQSLPLPHGHMRWDAPATFWATTRAVQHLLAPVADGGAGLTLAELEISGAWVWPQQSRLLRGWAEVLKEHLDVAQAVGDQFRIDYVKNIYKAFLGRMAGGQWPPGQRHWQQPAWTATIHADTRARALRYATRIASEHGLYPIAARDIDTFVYRLPAELDPAATLDEASTVNGKYRVKNVLGGEG